MDESKHSQVVAEGMANENAIAENLGYLSTTCFQINSIFKVLSMDATDMGSIVGDWLFRGFYKLVP